MTQNTTTINHTNIEMVLIHPEEIPTVQKEKWPKVTEDTLPMRKYEDS